MASRASATGAPVRFGREEPYDFTCFDEFFEADYAPSRCRTIHLGCRDGRTTVHLARRGYQILGIDPDRELLAAARERSVMAGVELDLMAGDPLALPPLPEESFCLAVDLWTAGALPAGIAREDYLRRVLKLLMRNGVLVASAPAPIRDRESGDEPFAFAGPFVSDFTRAGFEVIFEGIRATPPGERRLIVHARKPA